MGTVLSISPTSDEVGTPDESKSLKKPSVIVSTLTFRRLMTVSAKKKSVKKIGPNPPPAEQTVDHLNNENVKKSSQQSSTQRRSKTAPLPVPIPTVPTQKPEQNQISPGPKQIQTVQKQASSQSLLSPRRVVVQASTGELLRCLGEFLCRRCFKLKELSPGEVIMWFRNVDRTLLIQGWQEQGFITPASLVFVYLLVKETVTDDIGNAHELQGIFLTCLYLAYSYLGNEISYPLKPFIIDANKDVFWDQSLGVINNLSTKMLQINIDPHFFTEVFQDLKNEGEVRKDGSDLDR